MVKKESNKQDQQLLTPENTKSPKGEVNNHSGAVQL